VRRSSTRMAPPDRLLGFARGQPSTVLAPMLWRTSHPGVPAVHVCPSAGPAANRIGTASRMSGRAPHHLSRTLSQFAAPCSRDRRCARHRLGGARGTTRGRHFVVSRLRKERGERKRPRAATRTNSGAGVGDPFLHWRLANAEWLAGDDLVRRARSLAVPSRADPRCLLLVRGGRSRARARILGEPLAAVHGAIMSHAVDWRCPACRSVLGHVRDGVLRPLMPVAALAGSSDDPQRHLAGRRS
jgi:hypothetical protein